MHTWWHCHQVTPCPFYIQPKACRIWARRTNGLKIASTQAGFEPTISRLKVEYTNHNNNSGAHGYGLYIQSGNGRNVLYLSTCASSEDSDQLAHSRRLIRLVTGRILDSQGCQVSSCEQRRLWSHCADAHADMSLHWANMSEDTISHVAAQTD